jgi:hypothetical protein
MSRQHVDSDLDRAYSLQISLLGKIVRHTCFVLLGIGLALFSAYILGFDANASLFVMACFPVLFKTVILLGCTSFVLVLLESVK